MIPMEKSQSRSCMTAMIGKNSVRQDVKKRQELTRRIGKAEPREVLGNNAWIHTQDRSVGPVLNMYLSFISPLSILPSNFAMLFPPHRSHEPSQQQSHERKCNEDTACDLVGDLRGSYRFGLSV